LDHSVSATLYRQVVSSPVGHWIIKANDQAIDFSVSATNLKADPNSLTDKAATQLEEYFAGDRTTFDLPLATANYSTFYQQVWSALLEINYGSMVSYADIAQSLNNPKAVRAVGMANGKNPIPIFIPCHRVIGSDRSLTGYAHGLKVKKWLLELEGAIAETPTLF